MTWAPVVTRRASTAWSWFCASSVCGGLSCPWSLGWHGLPHHPHAHMVQQPPTLPGLLTCTYVPAPLAGRSRGAAGGPSPATPTQILGTNTTRQLSVALYGTVTLPLNLSATWLAPGNATTNCSSAFPTPEVRVPACWV